MNFHGSLTKLFEVNIEEIKNFVESLSEEDWNKWNYRQKTFDVHSRTKTYPLCWSEFVDGNCKLFIKNEKMWDIVIPYLERLEFFYGGRYTNIMFANLLPNGSIPRHTDVDFLTQIHRCHLPIKTNKNVIFGVGDMCYNLEEGTCYEINNTLPHFVNNKSLEDRIHLIIDILPNTSNINLEFIYE